MRFVLKYWWRTSCALMGIGLAVYAGLFLYMQGTETIVMGVMPLGVNYTMILAGMFEAYVLSWLVAGIILWIFWNIGGFIDLWQKDHQNGEYLVYDRDYGSTHRRSMQQGSGQNHCQRVPWP